MNRNVRSKLVRIYLKHMRERGNTLTIATLISVFRRIERLVEYSKVRLVERGLRRVKPDVYIANISLTSSCNFRCRGCLYGSGDFMPNSKLDIAVIKRVLDDLKELNVYKVHLYGGEPLLHDGVFEAVEYATRLGIRTELGTNGSILKEKHVERLYEAGLRRIGIGFYGVGEDHDRYVGRPDSYSKVEENIRHIRSHFPDLRISLGYLLMKPSCNLASLQEMLDISKKYEVPFSVNLVHYDFPYFSGGPNNELLLYEEDREEIDSFVKELVRLKQLYPDLVQHSLAGIRSIPDWLTKKENMRVPCHRYKHVWIGPNGITRTCQKNVDLGDVNDSRLKDILYTDLHSKSAQTCYELNCTNCYVEFDRRVNLHSESRKKYSVPLGVGRLFSHLRSSRH